MPFDNPLPPPPGPHDKYNQDRDRRALNHANELQSRVRTLEILLAPYLETFFISKDNKKLAALCRFQGNDDSDGFHPFELVDVSDPGEMKVRVVMGTINALDPVEHGPFETGDTPPCVIDVGDGTTVYVVVTLHYDTTLYWVVDSFDIGTSAQNDATHASFALGTIAATGPDITNIVGTVNGNIGLMRCGDADSTDDKWWAGP